MPDNVQGSLPERGACCAEAVPKKILELMPRSDLTRENVASHLQVCSNVIACPSLDASLSPAQRHLRGICLQGSAHGQQAEFVNLNILRPSSFDWGSAVGSLLLQQSGTQLVQLASPHHAAVA